VDSRIRDVIERAVQSHHRAMIVLVGDRGKDQVVNLHYMLSKAAVRARPSVLWCYKSKLGFSSHRKKRMKHIQKMVQRGLLDRNAAQEDPFELFISSTEIRYAYYHETQNILGNTYGMCVLQDFEAITPNLLARTIETVQGGGLVVILLGNMASLRTLYGMTMDAHAKLKTGAFGEVRARFNERFILSLADCSAAVVADDELNVLPISSHIRGGGAGPAPKVGRPRTKDDLELEELRGTLKDTYPVGALVEKSRTVDQAKALMTLVESISEKTLRSTVAVTASRGRGKSAALGLAVAAAIAHEYSNIFVTAPSPENLRTFFAFLLIGFDAMDYQEHTDYEILRSTDPAMEKCVVRVNVFRGHRQTVQYIDPVDASKALGQAELVVVDEAAAIPLPIVRAMLGPYLVFLSSTVTGYEGTGRSLSLKLIHELRARSGSKVSGNASVGRVFREVEMETPIRYASNDPIERWLYDVLCLDAGSSKKGGTSGNLRHAAPHPDQTSLYLVDRDALFSHHRASEAFLQRVMSLFVASHYKNSPNDLLTLSDAPAHQLFVLLGPADIKTAKLPDILCAIQVCLEGRISKQSVLSSMSRAHRAAGDLVPWTLVQQFQDAEFAGLLGARVVRIATHPDVQRMGYGSHALQLLIDFFSKKIPHLADVSSTEANGSSVAEAEDEEVAVGDNVLMTEEIAPRTKIPPLLKRLTEITPESLDYVSVSFGVTPELFRFWKSAGFLPVYTRLTANDLTGEHTCIMLRIGEASSANQVWLNAYYQDFQKRFTSLLGFEFRKFPSSLALSMLDEGNGFSEERGEEKIEGTILPSFLSERITPYDIRRLETYAKNLIDFHVILDLVPEMARTYFIGGLSRELHLSAVQRAILLSFGLQHKTVEQVEQDLGLPVSQILALFNKAVRKLAHRLSAEEEKKLEKDDEDTGARESVANEASPHSSSKERISSLPGHLQRFSVVDDDHEWSVALAGEHASGNVPGTVSIRKAGIDVHGAGEDKLEFGKDSRGQKDKKRKRPR